MSMFTMKAIAVATGLAFALPLHASDDDSHGTHSDIEITVNNNNQLELTNDELFDLETGKVLFEGEFGSEGVPNETDDPGFLVEEFTFNPNDTLWYLPQGALKVWDAEADAFVAPAGQEQIRIEGEFAVGSIIISADGVSDSNPVLVGPADATGVVHEHVEYIIETPTGETPAVGAYLVELSVFGISADFTGFYSPSDSFFVLFNNGLEEEAFEAIVEEMTGEDHGDDHDDDHGDDHDDDHGDDHDDDHGDDHDDDHGDDH